MGRALTAPEPPAAAADGYRQLRPGDLAPWFQQRTSGNPAYVFDTVGGRYIVLCFFGSSREGPIRDRLARMMEARARFDDERLSFFGITTDPADVESIACRDSLPGVRHFWDLDGKVSRLYGALPAERAAGGDNETFRPRWLVLHPNLQVKEVVPFATDGRDSSQVLELLDSLPPVERYAGMDTHAPVAVIPDLFEPAFCSRLIAEYDRSCGETSGFMRDEGGRTVGIHDVRHKFRRDHLVDDDTLRRAIRRRMQPVVETIRRAFAFEATRMERYLVGCYDASDGAHFRQHRDNTTRGTAYRRFALSLNLNDDFDGGDLAFPEYGARVYKPPPGAGIVFSCSLLHAVVPMRRGRRYAFLPFFYDEAAAQLRERSAA